MATPLTEMGGVHVISQILEGTITWRREEPWRNRQPKLGVIAHTSSGPRHPTRRPYGKAVAHMQPCFGVSWWRENVCDEEEVQLRFRPTISRT